MKNLSVRVDGGAIVDGHGIADGRAIPEILRFTQDDKGIAKRLASSRIEAEGRPRYKKIPRHKRSGVKC